MDNAGKQFRLKKIINRPFNIIFALDHGLTQGMVSGIESMDHMAEHIQMTPCHAILAHRGVLGRLVRRDAIPSDRSMIMHLNGSSQFSGEVDRKQLLTSVDYALQFGVDAVSIQLNFTSDNSSHNLSMLSSVSEQAERSSLPLLVMVYIKSPMEEHKLIQQYRHMIRMCYEMNVDMIKVPLPGSIENISALLQDVASDGHIFFAGGACDQVGHLMKCIRPAFNAGARGFCIGRNIFQNPDRGSLMRMLSLCANRICDGIAEDY